MRWIAMALPLLCTAGRCIALDGTVLDFQSLSANGVQLEGIHIALQSAGAKPPNLQLTVNKISLPQPFDVLSFFELRCAEFTLNSGIRCTGGQAKIVSPWLDNPKVRIAFQVSQAQSSLTLDGVKFAGGSFKFSLHYAQKQWRARLAAQNLQAPTLQRLLALPGVAVSNGVVDVNADAQGKGTQVDDVQAALQVRQLNAQSGNGKHATENLRLSAKLQGQMQAEVWQWDTQLQIHAGALYSEPVYIAAGKNALELQGHGQWRPNTRQLRITEMTLTHPGVAHIEGQADFENGALRKGLLSLQTETLDKFSAVYLQPFLTATAAEGLGLSGRLQARAEFAAGTLSRIDLQTPHLQVSDSGKRLALQNAASALHWAKDRPPQASNLNWEQLRVYGLPLGPANLDFSAYERTVRLNHPVLLPLFDGELRVARFDWLGRTGGEPEVHFYGDIAGVSLQNLTDTLHWPPLSGQLSGTIPGVHYRNQRLAMDGTLQIGVFDGQVQIDNLRLSGLLGDLPRLHANLNIDNLDLRQITRRFAFGSMQGRLSGFVRDLELENWQPVTFNAWLGTPANDDSTHRISQKAVNNLASIGGGGATDIVSRGLLSVFDNFSYDRLGIGCYLRNGVCQLSGVAPAEQGFYIVKGGGLPRIDVIGYNSRIDWQILLQRLRRVVATDSAIIQ